MHHVEHHAEHHLQPHRAPPLHLQPRSQPERPDSGLPGLRCRFELSHGETKTRPRRSRDQGTQDLTPDFYSGHPLRGRAAPPARPIMEESYCSLSCWLITLLWSAAPVRVAAVPRQVIVMNTQLLSLNLLTLSWPDAAEAVPHRPLESLPACLAAPLLEDHDMVKGHRARAPNAKLLDTVAPRTTPRVRLRW